MNESVLDRYRAALQAGHLAIRAGRLEEAADAYRLAIELAPDRPVPRTSLGAACLRLGEPVAALEAYEAALELAPGDEAALLGRAQALVVLRRPDEAALTLERLAGVRAADGRPGDACDALRRALEIEPTSERRRLYVDFAEELRRAAGDAEAERALRLARGLLGQEPSVGVDETREGLPETAANAPPPDGEVLAIQSEEAADAADVPGALETALAAARAHRAAGHPVAAIDTLLRAQPLAPDDRELHLLLAELQADRGWTALAAEKLRHLARLAALDGDEETAARILGTSQPAAALPADPEPDPG